MIFGIISIKSFACTPVYRLTLEETIEKSEAIIVATVVDFVENKSNSKDSSILFEVDEILKGKMKDNYIKIKGKIVSHSLSNKNKIPYKRGRRRSSNGECLAIDYDYGSSYLLMIKDGTPHWSAFNATNEKITGGNDPWLMWIKGFLAGMEYRKQKEKM